jgi:hypothetical protein
MLTNGIDVDPPVPPGWNVVVEGNDFQNTSSTRSWVDTSWRRIRRGEIFCCRGFHAVASRGLQNQ